MYNEISMSTSFGQPRLVKPVKLPKKFLRCKRTRATFDEIKNGRKSSNCKKKFCKKSFAETKMHSKRSYTKQGCPVDVAPISTLIGNPECTQMAKKGCKSCRQLQPRLRALIRKSYELWPHTRLHTVKKLSNVFLLQIN